MVSFIIPVYNVESYLSRCIDSIIMVKNIDFEIILINDGSTDNSGLICDKYACEDKRISVIHQQNKGLGPSRNQGLAIAKGDYIIFIDSDDWIDAEEFLKLYDCAVKHRAEMVLGDFQYCYKDNSIKRSYISLQDDVCFFRFSAKDILDVIVQGNTFVAMACLYLFSREFINRINLSFENIVHEDELWTTKALSLASSIIFTRICFYNYYQRENSIMYSTSAERRVASLFAIAYSLLIFIKDRRVSNYIGLEVTSFVLLRISELYNKAFLLLSKLKDSSVSIPNHHLHSLFHNRVYLNPSLRKRYLYNYFCSIRYLRDYNHWRHSIWVRCQSEKEEETCKLILVYNLMWDSPLDVPIGQIPIGYKFTIDRKYMQKADMVVFHLPTLRYDLDVDLVKPEHQKWVGWSLECEENYPYMKDQEFMDIFDYVMTYKKDADIVFPYYKSNYGDLIIKSFKGIPRDNICMLVSSHLNKSSRQEYLKDLMKHTYIDSYGKLYNNQTLKDDNGRESKLRLYEQYKFVISFENACATDYVTEKFYDPLLSGSVPVYLGANNIEDFAPGVNCYIDVRKYPNPKDLAEHLNACINDADLYMSYHMWRQNSIKELFKHKLKEQVIHPFIRLCDLI